MNWKSVYDKYPVNDNMIWLNNCGITPAGDHIVKAVNSFITEYSQKGPLARTADQNMTRKRIKEILSELLGCHPDELCLIHNTSEGMNFISHGLEFKENDEIILLENEYPSNIYPWKHLESKGVTLITAPSCASPGDFFKNLKKLVTEKTRLISVSAVHWCTGMPLPLEKVGNLCREKGIYFVVDGAQGVGMQPIDTKKMKIDFMALSAWKWLMGPLGLGVMYVAKDKLSDVGLAFLGTESVVDDEKYLPYKDVLKPSADRFTISTPSTGDWVYFLASLEFLHNIGFEKIRMRIYELAEHLTNRLRSIGFTVISENFPDYPTAIVVCEKEGLLSEALVAKLKQENIIAAERLGRIRFSPHIYISEQQLDKAVNALSKASVTQMYAKSMRGGS